MIYPGTGEVTAGGLALRCPGCGNTVLQPEMDYCPRCGESRRNLCRPEGELAPRHTCPPDARFCEQCGAPTAFLLGGLLRPWETFRTEK